MTSPARTSTTRRVATLSLPLACVVLVGNAGPAAAQVTNPTFTRYDLDTPAERPSAIGLADFDGDAVIDVVTLAVDAVTLRAGDGTGGLGEPSTFSVGASPRAISVGSLNGSEDLLVDAVTANYFSSSLTILEGNGAGGFTLSDVALARDSQPHDVAVGDVNADGLADLVTANSGTDDATVLLGDGFGGFTPAVSLAAGDDPRSVVLGDFDGDPFPDIAVGSINSRAVALFHGLGGGEFSAGPVLSTGQAFSLVSGSFNSDAIDDIAIASSDRGTSVLLSSPDGGFQHQDLGGSARSSVRGGDLNADGVTDLVAAGSATLTVFYGDGTGGFTSDAIAVADTDPNAAAVGLVDSGLLQDIVTVTPSPGKVSVLLQDAPTVVAPPPVVPEVPLPLLLPIVAGAFLAVSTWRRRTGFLSS